MWLSQGVWCRENKWADESKEVAYRKRASNPRTFGKNLSMNVCVDDEVRFTKSSNKDSLGVDGLSNKNSEDKGNGELEHVCNA